VVVGYLAASPARVDAAKRYLTQLDALSGAEAAVGKVRAYRSLAIYYWRSGDTQKMVGASERLIAVGKELNDHDRNEYGSYMFLGYRYLAEAEAARTGDSVAPKAVMTRAAADIGKLMGIDQMLRNYTSLFGLYGAKAQRIVADSWITTSADTVLPVAGKFNLVVFRMHRGNIPAVRRLGTQYAGKLKVVGVMGTIGYFRDLGPLTPQLETQELRKYFLEDLKIPGAVAVNNTVFNKMPDGRRQADPTPNERAYRSRTGATVMLVDPQGIIRRVWVSWDKSYEVRIDEAIQRLSSGR
jgi:hypothetical protein